MLLNTELPSPPVSASTKLVPALKTKQMKFILPRSNTSWTVTRDTEKLGTHLLATKTDIGTPPQHKDQYCSSLKTLPFTITN